MIKLFVSFFLFLLGGAANAQLARHVIIVSIDGFRPDFYLEEKWGAVNLRQLMEEGVHAKGVTGIFPTVTFPSHTSIVTGARPLNHGIFYNAPFEPGGATGNWYWNFDAIRCATLWQAVRQKGGTSASVLWPVSAGAPIDYNVPDIWAPGSKSDRREITSRSSTPRGLFQELERNATGKMEANDFNLDKDYTSMDDNVARMAAYLIRKHKPALTTVHLPAVDHAEHAEGRDGPQVRRAISGADHALRIIREAVEKAGIAASTAVIVTGDHGFADKHTNLYPNVWLAQAGLIGDLKKGEWKARFHESGGSAFLYLKDPEDVTTLNQVRQILSSLPPSVKKSFRVMDQKELKRVGADPAAPLALAAVQGTAFGAGFTGEAVQATQGGVHGYFPDFPQIQTGFVGWGAGFKKGAVLPEMELVDIAPLVARLLGLDFKAADGVLHPGILTN